MVFVLRHTSSKKCLQRHLYKNGHLCPRGLFHGEKHFLSALCRLSYRRLGVRYGTTQIGKGLLCLVASTENTNGYILQQQLQRLPRSRELWRPQRRLHGRRQPLFRSFSQTRFWCSPWCREVCRTTNTIAFAKSLWGTKKIGVPTGTPYRFPQRKTSPALLFLPRFLHKKLWNRKIGRLGRWLLLLSAAMLCYPWRMTDGHSSTPVSLQGPLQGPLRRHFAAVLLFPCSTKKSA